MAVFIVYFILFAFWSEHSLGFELEKLFGLGMGFSLKNISLFLLMVAWFFSVRNQQRLYLPTNINKFIFFFIGVVILSILPVLSGYVLTKRGIIYEIIKLKMLVNPWLFFFFISQIISSKKDCQKSIWGLIALLIVNVVVSSLDSYGLTHFGTSGGRKYAGRAMGFTEANQYAAFIVLILPQLLSSTFFQVGTYRRILSGSCFMLGLFGLINTVSRGGLIAFFVSLLTFFTLANKKKLIKIKTIFICIIFFFVACASIYILAPEEARSTFNRKVFDEEEATLAFNPWAKERSWLFEYSSGRTRIWSDVLDVYIQKPILGLGLEGYKEKRKIATHNDYLKYLVDHGIFGLFFYLLICIGIIRFMYKNYKKCSDISSLKLYIGYLAGTLGFFTAMFAVNIYETRNIFWVYTALMYKFAKIEPIDAQ